MEPLDQFLDQPFADNNDPDLFLADTGKRLANYILDRIGIYIVIYTFIFALASSEAESALVAFLFLGVILMYYTLTEFLWGKTPAKFLTKTSVVTVDGERITFGTAFVRTLCRFIPFEPFSFLAGTVGWHDRISRTRVVSDDFFQE